MCIRDRPNTLVHHCTVTISDSSFLVIGGQFDPKAVLEYESNSKDPINPKGWKDMDKWDSLTSGRLYHGCARLENQVIVAGGIEPGTASINKYKSIEIIDIYSRTIRGGCDMLEERFRFSLVVVEEWAGIKLLALGGVSSHSVEEYNSLSLIHISEPTRPY